MKHSIGVMPVMQSASFASPRTESVRDSQSRPNVWAPSRKNKVILEQHDSLEVLRTSGLTQAVVLLASVLTSKSFDHDSAG